MTYFCPRGYGLSLVVIVNYEKFFPAEQLPNQQRKVKKDYRQADYSGKRNQDVVFLSNFAADKVSDAAELRCKTNRHITNLLI